MSSGVCQAQTWIQAQCVLGINHMCGVLGFQHNVYLDPSTMCTRIGAQGCHQTRIQAPSVLRLDQQGRPVRVESPIFWWRRRITQLSKRINVHSLTTTIQGRCTLATDTPTPVVDVILWSTTTQPRGHLSCKQSKN
jgi:hypothetical protein